MTSSTTYLARTCPSCRSNTEREPCRTASNIPAETLSLEELQSQWNGFFKEKAFFTYNRCAACGLLFCPTFFTPGQLEMLYSQMPDNTAGVPIDALRRTQRGYYKILERHPVPKGDFLEIGPDIGLFTENAIGSPHYQKYWLFEPNRAVWPALTEKLAGAPHQLSDQMFQFDEIPDNSVSAVVMIHVLDHLIDPVETLTRLRAKLKPGALLLFVTHDESSLLAKAIGTRWPPYCLQHPQLYSPRSIGECLKHSGYKTIETRKTYNHFPVMYLAKHLLWALGVRNVNLPMQDRFCLPLKLGNIATVATTTNH